MPNRGEKEKFVGRSFGEIKPLLDKGEQNLDPEDPANAEIFLERYRDKLFFEEKDSSNPDAQRLLITATDPGAYNAIGPLIAAFEKDPRCKGIGALVSGLARKNVESEFKDRLREVKSDAPTLFQEVMELSEQKPFDAVVATASSLNGSEGVALYGGKSNLGARKIFVVTDGWGTLGSQFLSGQRENMDDVDVIFCSDAIAKKLYQYQSPDIPEVKFEITGSPIIDGLRVENPTSFAKQARERFSLGEKTEAIAYLGGISADLASYGADEAINEKTFAQTLEAIVQLATVNSDHEYALLVRPHPRDPNKEEFFAEVARKQLPPNLKIIPAGRDVGSIQELRYAVDTVMSIGSTENFLAPRLGRSAIFLGFKGKGLGGEYLEQIYGQKLVDEIVTADPKIHIAASPEGVAEILKNHGRAPQNFDDMPIFKQPDSVEVIKNRILG